MSQIKRLQISYGFWVALISFFLSLINDFGSNFLFLHGRETNLILLVIIVITINQLNQRESLDKLREDIILEVHSIDAKTSELIAKTSELVRNDRAGVITEVAITRVFDDFIGEEYYAYNAPLQYENESLKDRLEFHIKRYKNDGFKMAHYYYPIFSLSDKDSAKEWMEGVRDFYQNLNNNNNRLTRDEKQKVTFYVPTGQYTFSPASNITYFIGKKHGGYEAIVYIHNDIFMELQGKRPKIMFRIYDDKMIDLLRQHRTDTTKRNMNRIIGIEDFLKYLEEELK
jgi:hypothetical protein